MERANRNILEALRCTVGGEDPDWDKDISQVKFSINSNFNESIGMSPHKALFGIEPRNAFDLISQDSKCDEPVDTLI